MRVQAMTELSEQEIFEVFRLLDLDSEEKRHHFLEMEGLNVDSEQEDATVSITASNNTPSEETGEENAELESDSE